MQCGDFIKILPNYQSTRTAMVLRYENIPFDVPVPKNLLTAKIRRKKELGFTNIPMYFNAKRFKSTIIYLEAFDSSTSRRILQST